MNRSRKLLLVWFVFAICASALALDRQAFTFTNYTLKVTIDPAKQTFAATGSLQARNDTAIAQKNIVLQISGSLQWTAVTVGKEEVPWVQQTYTTDIDHTGEVSEAILTLPTPIAPGASTTINFSYEGTITLNTGRLLRVNTPGNYAARTDWDQISDSFTAVRGLGYVAWYPVALDAVRLSEGTAVWDAIAQWKLRHLNSAMHATFAAPADKQVVTNADESSKTAGGQEVVFHSLGRATPTFAAAAYQTIERASMTVYHLAEHTQIARDYVVAAEKVLPQMTEYFGSQKHKLVVVELSNEDVLPFDDGSPVFFSPMMKLDPAAEEMLLGHQIVHTILYSQRPWINEGLAHFAQLLIRERQAGREETLAYLNQFRPALVEAEQAAQQMYPGKGQPLATSNDAVYYRSKSIFVWYMLRDLVGDKALSAAIQTYKPEQDTQPGYMQSLIETQTTPRKSLEQFFDDWVYRDLGLPDFKIASVYPRATLGTTYVVTITVENSGAPGAQVAAGVMSDKGERTERTFVPGHGKAVVRVAFPGTPQKAWVNDGSVPETDVKNNTFDIPAVPRSPQP